MDNSKKNNIPTGVGNSEMDNLQLLMRGWQYVMPVTALATLLLQKLNPTTSLVLNFIVSYIAIQCVADHIFAASIDKVECKKDEEKCEEQLDVKVEWNTAKSVSAGASLFAGAVFTWFFKDCCPRASMLFYAAFLYQPLEMLCREVAAPLVDYIANNCKKLADKGAQSDYSL